MGCWLEIDLTDTSSHQECIQAFVAVPSTVHPLIEMSWLKGPMQAMVGGPRSTTVQPMLNNPSIRDNISTARSLQSSSAHSSSVNVRSPTTASIVGGNRAPSMTAISNMQEALPERYRHGKIDVWMLGITIVIGGQYFSWNAGFAAGFYSYLASYILVGTAYIALCCCSSEITGALPFAGGAYGLSRCTLGFLPGFFIGFCETLEYIAYVATTALSLSDMMIQAAPALEGTEPVLWFMVYASALWIQILGGQTFWRVNMLLGIASIGILLAFCFGSLPFVDFERNVINEGGGVAVGGGRGFFKQLPVAAWFFVGVEALSLASDEVSSPKIMVPIAQVSCILTLFVTGLMVLFITASLPADGGIAEIAGQLLPLNTGFMLMGISSTIAKVLSFPATYATGFGFIWCYGKLIQALATSRLLPNALATKSRYDTPYLALIAGSVVSYAICVVVYFIPALAQYVFPVCITSAFSAYTGQCIGYIAIKRNYKRIKSSKFVSPFGQWGALYSMSVWIAGMVSIACFQDDNYIEIGTFGCVSACVVVVYYAYAQKRQTFSPQENKVLLVAHVIKFNTNKVSSKGSARKIRKGVRHAAGQQSSTHEAQGTNKNSSVASH